MLRILTTIAAALIVTPALAQPIPVVASFSILGDMVRVVGGDRIALTTIVGPDADTHVYEPKPSDAQAVGKAKVFFLSGLGFEGWMDRLVQSTGYKGALVVASDGIASRSMVEGGETITDPHAWQDLSNGLIYVDNIEKGLCAADAAGCETYKANAEAYKREISALDAEVRAKVATVPADKRKVITTHDAFGYFGAAYGVKFLAPEGISTESEAAAADVAKLIDQIRAEKVTAVFVENMGDPRLMQQIASETGVKVGGALYADALSKQGEGADTYLDMFRHNVALIVPAMAGK